MKKIALALVIFFFTNLLNAQYVTIPDVNFRNLLKSQIPTAFNTNDEMDTTNNLVLSKNYLYCSGAGINNLDGVKYFKALSTLYCSYNQIASFSTLPNSLSYLDCSNNQITSLPNNLPVNLYTLNCSNNQINNLNNLPVSLNSLYCSRNNLTALNNLPSSLYYLDCAYNLISNISLPTSITYLYCSHNNLISLNNLPSNLYYLDCAYNQITNISLSNSLVNLYCSHNNLSSLPSFQNLSVFDCSYNQLTSLNININSLYNLICNNNQLTSLPALAIGSSKISIINCANNNLTGLPTLPTSLNGLNCDSNQITSLPALPQYLNYLSCNQNLLTSLPALPALQTLNCAYNNLTQLPQLPTVVLNLNCSHNQITSLPSFNSNMETINCSYNQLTSIPSLGNGVYQVDCSNNQLSCLGVLPYNLHNLNIANTNITCLQNAVANLQVTPNNITVCSSSNNTNGCTIVNPYVVIPDPNFRAYLISQTPGCFNANQELDTLCAASNSTLYYGTIDCRNLNIQTVEGIQYFKNAYYFYCDNNNISSINKLPNNLNVFSCSNNQITSLPTIPANISQINCSYNLLNNISVDSGGSNWYYFRTLDISHNLFTSFPAFKNRFSTINCSNNQLTNVSIKNLNGLSLFMADSNLISQFEFPSQPDSFRSLSLMHNNLQQLNEIPQTLGYLNIVGNNIYCLPKLPRYMYQINLDSGKITCLPNTNNYMQIFSQTGNVLNMGVCNPTNNANQCLGLPTITGKTFFDQNSNGVKDATENYLQWRTINTGDSLNQPYSNYTFSDNNGSYIYSYDDTGKYTVKYLNNYFWWWNNSPLLKAVPDSVNVHFNRFDTTAILPDIAYQPASNYDSMYVQIYPSWWARPGSQYAYWVYYENIGTTTLSPTITIKFDDTKLVYDSASFSGVVQNGNTLTFTHNNLQPFAYNWWWNSRLLYFTVKTTAQMGDVISTKAAVDYAGKQDSIPVWNTILRNSYDPNEKNATATLTPVQVANGTPISYTIHFQNTGTDTAYNVVIADTLSNLLQANTLQVVTSSHNVHTTVKNGVVYFEFKNIMLPDSGANQIGSNGFVTFIVKPLSTLTAGTNIYNKAHIYFDYNTAITTNNALTEIKNASILPLRSMSYTSILRSENVVENKWNTASEMNMSHYLVQKSYDGKSFMTVISQKATNKLNNSYQYDDLLTAEDLKHSLIYYRIAAIDINNYLQLSNTEIVRLNKNNKFIIFPNPATNNVVIEGKNISLIAMYDVYGKKIIQQTAKTITTNIDISKLPRGIYYIRILDTDNNPETHKLIIQ